MTRIREEDLPTLAKYLCHFGPVKTCVLGHIYITSTITFYRCVVFMIGCVYGVRCSRSVDQLTDVVTRLDLNHNISPSQVRITCTLVTHIIITCPAGQRAGLTSWHLVQPYLCSDLGQVAYLLGSGLPLASHAVVNISMSKERVRK